MGYTRALSFLLGLCFGLVGCAPKARNLAPFREQTAAELPDNSGQYERTRINAPEMFARELKMPERKELLRVNWAMQKALDQGKLNVRLLAPPLQLTGDPNLDRSSTYEAVLVADDLAPTNNFLDVYEVRLSPKPELYVVRPSASSESLKKADLVLAEEELARLRLDEATLNSGAILATNLQHLLDSRLAKAEAATSNEVHTLNARIALYEQRLATNQPGQAPAASNSGTNTPPANGSSETNKVTQPANAGGSPPAQPPETPEALRRQLLEAQEKLSQAKNRLNALRDQVEAARQLGDVTSSYHVAIKSFAQFWEQWSTARSYLTDYSTNGPSVPIKSAVSILFRPQAVANLPHITIDVIRKAIPSAGTATPDTNQSQSHTSAMSASTMSALRDALAGVNDLTSLLSRIERAPKSQVNAESKERQTQAIMDRLGSLAGDIRGYLELLTNDIHQVALRARDEVLQAYNPVQEIVVAVLENESSQPLAFAMTDLSNSVSAYRKDTHPRDQWAAIRDKLRPKVTTLQSIILTNAAIRAKAPGVTNDVRILSQRVDAAGDASQTNSLVADLKTNLLHAVSNILGLSTDVTVSRGADPVRAISRQNWLRQLGAETRYAQVLVSGMYALRSSKEASALGNPDASGVVGRILAGDQAVFRLNVLHGVVTTTGFLLADDGAAQIFGQAFADSFFAAQVTLKNQNDKPILVYGNTMRLVVRMNAVRADGQLSQDGVPLRYNWWATYEPLDYDAIRRMMEGQQEHSWQKTITKAIDLALMAGGGWVGVGAPGEGFTRAFGVISALSPKLKDMIEADLRRNAANFLEKGLHDIEEIPSQGIITRYVFLPKGPIYGTYAFDEAVAAELPISAAENRYWGWVPFVKTSRDFGRAALQPAYIHDIRREEVYVDGKRILASDPLTSAGAR